MESDKQFEMVEVSGDSVLSAMGQKIIRQQHAARNLHTAHVRTLKRLKQKSQDCQLLEHLLEINCPSVYVAYKESKGQMTRDQRRQIAQEKRAQFNATVKELTAGTIRSFDEFLKALQSNGFDVKVVR